MASIKSGVRVNPADLARLNAKMADLAEIDEDALPSVMNSAGKATVAQMERLAPVDTGRLRTNIDYSLELIENNTTIELESEAIDPDNGFDYAPVQNYGGRTTRGTSYFSLGVNDITYELYDRINKEIKRLFNRK